MAFTPYTIRYFNVSVRFSARSNRIRFYIIIIHAILCVSYSSLDAPMVRVIIISRVIARLSLRGAAVIATLERTYLALLRLILSLRQISAIYALITILLYRFYIKYYCYVLLSNPFIHRLVDIVSSCGRVAHSHRAAATAVPT